MEPRPPVIKIGETGEFAKRLRDLSKSKHGVQFDVEPLCVVRGTRSDEQAVFRYFDNHKVYGEEETFKAHDDLLDYIRWLRDQYFVWVPDDPNCPAIEDMEMVDANLWMPRPERKTPPPQQTGLYPEWGPLQLPPRVLTVDDFYTGERIIEAARQTMGGINLDPASHAVANRIVKAARFYTANENGLTREWQGRVWLNPPFSQWQEWVPKIVAEWQSGRLDCLCVLCATRTTTAQCLAPIHRMAQGICISDGRLPFWGGRAGYPDDGHAIFYLGREFERFRAAFADIGHVYRK